ncbi:MAG: DUF1647 domain-containing protein [Ramlibacter sp.]|nr:DUF1647 domain-containing protein [Ramlibacter sp.]
MALTFVSAASANYGRCLFQLLRSAERTGVHQGHPWVVYDLGLDDAQRAHLATRFAWVQVRQFDFTAYPPHVAQLAHSYAWKPALIHELVNEGVGPLLWLDAATLLHQVPAEVLAELADSGVYVLRGQTAVGLHCDPLTLARLAPPPSIVDAPEYAAGVIGLDAQRPGVRALVQQWFDWCMDPALICPRHPRLPRHKPEQSLLTLALRQAEHRGERAPQTREIDISSWRPVRWMSSRHKIPSSLPIWQEPLLRAWTRVYKWLDRMWLRADALDNRYLGGWRRFGNEHFTVTVGRRGSAKGTVLRAPWTSYWADPFVFEHAGQAWVLLEDFRYTDGLGHLLAVPLDDGLRAGAEAVAIDTGQVHTSFPFVFEHDGAVWMLPETCGRRSLDLYRFDNFPHGPRLVQRLLYDVNVADSVLFRHGARWWLMTSLFEPPRHNRTLALYHSEQGPTGPWLPHPVNAQGLFAKRRFSYGRCAGPPVQDGDTLLRPIHANEHYYGEKIEWRRITRLDEHHFEEEPAGPPADLAHAPNGADMHHVSLSAHLWATDTRDRLHARQALRRVWARLTGGQP